MKNLMIAAAVAAALQLPAGAQAATSDDLAQIRQQLQGLMQRVDKLEQENQTLKSENEQLKADGEKLKAEGDYLKAETKGLRKDAATSGAAVAAVKGADWAGKVALTGDVRYRYEAISDDTLNSSGAISTADRYRDRIRARIAATAKATDTLTVGIGLTTAEAQDPRSGNQSLGGVFSKKPIELDLAYFDWKFASWGDLVGGKMKQPLVKSAQNLFFDNDITPEGLAFQFNSGIWFGSVYNFWLNEVSGSETARTSDPMMHGAQVGVKMPVGAGSFTAALHYYELAASQGRIPGPFYNNNANGNTTITNGTDIGLLNNYEVFDVLVQWDTTFGTTPFQLWAEAAQNQDPDGFLADGVTPNDQDTAWSIGGVFGRASNANTWEAGVMYQKVEKDALFAQLIDSDFAGGVSDNEGFAFRFGYAPVRNWVLNATYFLTKRNVERANSAGQTEVDYDRLQLDFNVKF
ncbi:MAG TPA: putative porin [Steroidobacteraceae bacterium]|nr:putative porin [Steroidobacteraceae bacterium]